MNFLIQGRGEGGHGPAPWPRLPHQRTLISLFGLRQTWTLPSTEQRDLMYYFSESTVSPQSTLHLQDLTLLQYPLSLISGSLKSWTVRCLWTWDERVEITPMLKHFEAHCISLQARLSFYWSSIDHESWLRTISGSETSGFACLLFVCFPICTQKWKEKALRRFLAQPVGNKVILKPLQSELYASLKMEA